MPSTQAVVLGRLDSATPQEFKIPAKLINEGTDLATFLVSKGYSDILVFISMLSRSMFPTKSAEGPVTHPINTSTSPPSSATTVSGLRELLREFDGAILEAPPNPGPRRFGNISFRKWSELVEARCSQSLEKHLPAHVLNFASVGDVKASDELRAYLLGGFGSAQRLDYGTGHELSFLAFLAGIWKLGGFAEDASPQTVREIVNHVIQPYLELVRKLILTYNLEPAGSHGVWGLDDHSFIPYVLGSAQYGPAIGPEDPTPLEGSLPGAPDPGDIAKADKVRSLRTENLYFGAVGFINDVKTGPFWEHSPTLYDISGVKAGWGKINKGMVKMYNAEVLSKFPVIQHFPFGSLFSWSRSPDAPEHSPDVHSMSQPQRQAPSTAAAPGIAGPIEVTSTLQGAQAGLTKAPWAQGPTTRPGAPRMPPAAGPPAGPASVTRAPWGRQSGAPDRGPPSTLQTAKLPGMREEGPDDTNVTTKAPWAK